MFLLFSAAREFTTGRLWNKSYHQADRLYRRPPYLQQLLRTQYDVRPRIPRTGNCRRDTGGPAHRHMVREKSTSLLYSVRY